MTISNLLTEALPKVKWFPTPSLDIEILLSHVIGKDRVFISTNSNYKLSDEEKNLFEKLVEKRCQQEPIAYIVGYKDFYNYNFIVNKNVLIPRPETELLAEEALRFVKANKLNCISDVGTGSGCIILTIAKEMQKKCLDENVNFIATDSSEEALGVANQNYEKHFPKKDVNIQFIKSNLLEKIDNKIDLLISNLPYIPRVEYKKLERSVIDFEPEQALVGGESGYELIEELLKQAKEKVNKKSLILLEINYNQGDIVASIAKSQFPRSKVDLIKDYANFARIIKIENN